MTTPPEHPKSLKVTYFDFHGGRGESARIALSIAGIPFEDDRVKFQDWPARKATTPFGSLPILEVDGRQLTQSNSINRYCGRLAGLYPEDPWKAAKCDEVSDIVEHLNVASAPSFSMSGDEQKRERERLLDAEIPLFFKGLARLVEEGGGEWFVDGRLTMADLKVQELVRMLESGSLDHIPKETVDTIAPTISAHRKRVLAHPDVKAYYAKVGA